jgi:hypothetical protein
MGGTGRNSQSAPAATGTTDTMKDVPNFGSESAAQARKRRWAPIAWLLSGFLVAYAYAFISATASDSEHLSGCQAIVSAVTSRHRLPLSVSEPGSPAVSCDLGVHFPLLRTYYTVFIYGVLDKGEQDAIVVDLRTFQSAAHRQKILVQFFEKENWKTWSDPNSGRSGGSRGPETPIFKTWIN